MNSHTTQLYDPIDEQVAAAWDAQAGLWSHLCDAGLDLHRTLVNEPAFLSMLPDVEGWKGLDVGCGDGTSTRLMSDQGTKMVGVDICEEFIDAARGVEASEPQGISYVAQSGRNLPFQDSTFDLATAFMSLHDMARPWEVLAEVRRVVRPGGLFQFVILHPVFTYKGSWIGGAGGPPDGRVVSGYFDTDGPEQCEWMFPNADASLTRGKTFKYPVFRYTLEEWFGFLSRSGMMVRKLCEPRPGTETLERHPSMATHSGFPCFLLMQCEVS